MLLYLSIKSSYACQNILNLQLNVLYFHTVRLANGSTPFEGRVEVLYQGVWGTVCDDLWEVDDAEVVCRQLGYGRALAGPREAKFGRGKGHIWLDWVECDGNENSISECGHDGWGDAFGCDHGDDAGAVCLTPGEYKQH